MSQGGKLAVEHHHPRAEPNRTAAAHVAGAGGLAGSTIGCSTPPEDWEAYQRGFCSSQRRCLALHVTQPLRDLVWARRFRSVCLRGIAKSRLAPKYLGGLLAVS